IGSGELTNAPFLLHVARLGKPIILSTGMATLEEIETALAVIAFGFANPDRGHPGPLSGTLMPLDPAARKILRGRVTLLHCTSEYPAVARSINLRAMATLREAFGLPIGLSDHSRGIH